MKTSLVGGLLKGRLIGTTMLCVGALVPVTGALAAEGGIKLEEITVTATKRGFAESLQSVPMSIQAISERQLTAAGVKDFMDFARLAPSVSVVDQGYGSAQISIRGVRAGSIPTTTTQEKPLTSVYIDDLPVSLANFNPNLDMFDVQRVEVLRGPQGTLYGAGAMGGNVRFVTNSANLTEMEAKVEGTIASIHKGSEIYDFKGLVNIPVIEDKLALRITGTGNWDGGYVDNTYLGEKDWNESERIGFRISALYQATDDLAITANILYQDAKFDKGRSTINVPVLDDPQQVIYGALPFTDEMTIYNLVVEYDLGWATLHSSSSYFDRNIDNSGTVQDLIEVVLGIQTEYPNRSQWSNEDFVQEVRLSSNGDNALNWVVGGFYSNQKSAYDQAFTIPGSADMFGFPDLGAPDPDILFFGDVDNDQDQISFFGEATYKITEQLHATVGLRWFDWQQDFTLIYAGLFQGGYYALAESTSASKVTPKFNISYHSEDESWMVYANAAKGFRLGGLNEPVPVDLCAADLAASGLANAPVTFDPDSLWSYELGAKTEMLDDRMTVNAAAFYIDWSDVQTLKTLPNCGFYFTENVGAVKSKGLEFEMTALAAEGLTVSLSGTYTDATLSEDVPNLNAVDGDRVPFTPKFAFAGAVDYAVPLTDTYTGTARLDVQHVGKRSTEFNRAVGVNMPSYEIVNLHLGMEAENWGVTLFAKNLFDKRAVVNAATTVTRIDRIIERPRTIGVTLRAHY